MRPITVTANRAAQTANVTAATVTMLSGGTRSGNATLAPVYTVTFTHDQPTVTFPLNSFIVVSGSTPAAYDGTWRVIQTAPGTVTVSYRGASPGTWVSGSVITRSTASPGIVPDNQANMFAIGIGCVVSGTVTYTVQHTFDDPFDLSVNPTWFDQPAAGINAKTANADGNYQFPVREIRVNATAGTGSVAMTLIQVVQG